MFDKDKLGSIVNQPNKAQKKAHHIDSSIVLDSSLANAPVIIHGDSESGTEVNNKIANKVTSDEQKNAENIKKILKELQNYKKPQFLIKDYRNLQQLARKYQNTHHGKDPEIKAKLLQQIVNQYTLAKTKFLARQKNVPAVSLNMDLPVALQANVLKAAIQNNQVVIVAGETGSGKTTQLPLIALQAGRGVTGQIGHTQPRRLAASSVAARIAEELKQPLGQDVSFKVRFLEKGNDNAYIKLMTDGILLAELGHDPYLNKYDTIIIDEAHERSLNIDFLLGYLRILLTKRSDLKLVITSATIDVERFSAFFNGAPIISVQGRAYPVEVRYRPLIDAVLTSSDDDRIDEFEDKLPRAVVAAVEECVEDAKEKNISAQADILIFASTEQEIRELQQVLERYGPPHTQILPLFARQSIQDQQRIFTPSGVGRRIIIATNVAETSLTVPNIRYVIDTGFARMSRYSVRSRVQRLPIEAISQAAANQRKGRCGRIADGVCIRLFSEEDFNQRSLFTDPEIKRTNLASVILQLASLKLGNLEEFPFIDRPEGRYVTDATKRLVELGALEEVPLSQINPSKYQKNRTVLSDVTYDLTEVGQLMAKLPIDPMLARMLIAADHFGALHEILIIVSALAMQDIKERPHDKQAQADQKHALFKQDKSDFLFYLQVWQALHPVEGKLNDKQKKQFAKTHFLSALRIREWERLHRQLQELVAQLKLSINDEPATYENIHQSLLTGLLAHIGHKQDNMNEYLLPKQLKAKLFSASTLSRQKAPWLVAFEMVETSQTFLRLAAQIEPEWVIKAAQPLLKYHYFEPYWSKKTGVVNAYAQISLWGLILENRYRVRFDPIDLKAARQVFIQSALVETKLGIDLPFIKANRALLEQIEEAEHLLRRRDLLPLETDLYTFYNKLVPEHIASRKAFLDWYHTQTQHNDVLLTFDINQFHVESNQAIQQTAQIKRTEHFGHLELPIEFVYDPSIEHDGVFIDLPLIALAQINQDDINWGINLWRRELVLALLQSLPKVVRKQLLPLAPLTDEILKGFRREEFARITHMLVQSISKLKGIKVIEDQFNWQDIAGYLKPTIRILNNDGAVIDQGNDLNALQQKYVKQQQSLVQPRLVNTNKNDVKINESKRHIKQAEDQQVEISKNASVDNAVKQNALSKSSIKGSLNNPFSALNSLLPQLAEIHHAKDAKQSKEKNRNLIDSTSTNAKTQNVNPTTNTNTNNAQTALNKKSLDNAVLYTQFPTDFTFETIIDVNGIKVKQFNALMLHSSNDGKKAQDQYQVSAQTLHQERYAREVHKNAVVHLIANELSSAKYLTKQFDHKLLLAFMSYGTTQQLALTAQIAVINIIMQQVPYTKAAFDEVLQHVKTDYLAVSNQVTERLKEILTLLGQVKSQLNQFKQPIFKQSTDDILDQLDAFMIDKMLTDIPYNVWKEYPRYLLAILKRLERLNNNLNKDLESLESIDNYMAQVMSEPKQLIYSEARWALEELRIQLFAQPMKTKFAISQKKLAQMWQ